MNKVILIGNLANDPESRTTQNGIAQCSFRIAVQRRFKGANGERETDFLPVVCWRQTAEFAQRYLAKGRKVAVEGSIQTRSYGAQDGSKRYVTEIIADSVEAVGGREEGAQNAQNTRSTQQAQNAQKPAQNQQTEFTEVDDDELPF